MSTATLVDFFALGEDDSYWQWFRKRPVVIRAYQTNEALYISTLEGSMKAEAGDWIIEGVNGELYPCKPDIFIKTYERVE